MAKAEQDSLIFPGRTEPQLHWRARLWREWREREWWALSLLWLAALVLGFIGFRARLAALGEGASIGDCLYRALQLFALKSGEVAQFGGWPLNVARFLAPAVAAYTAVRALLLVFIEQWHVIRACFARNHVVVCGLGPAGFYLTHGFLRRGRKVVVIEHEPQSGLVEFCRDEGAIVLIGNATDPKVLSKAGVQRAACLFVVCNNDATNAEVMAQASRLVTLERNPEKPPLTCVVQIEELSLYRHLRETSIAQARVESLRVQYFNIYRLGARALLRDFPFLHEGSARKDRPPHLLVVGVGRMGENLILEAARLWQGQNQAPADSPTAKQEGASPPVQTTKLHVTILDRKAAEKQEALFAHYPYLAAVCELHAVTMDVGSPAFRHGRFLLDNEGREGISHAYVCFDDDSLSFTTGLRLLERLRNHEHPIPIVIRLRHEAGLASLTQEAGQPSSDGGSLRAFGLLNRVCTPDLLRHLDVEAVARAIHQHYVARQQAGGISPETDPATLPWDELPGDLQESRRRQAEHIGVKLRDIRCRVAPHAGPPHESPVFSPTDLDTMARMEYERRMAERIRTGRTPGKGVNVSRPAIPNPIPWDELPDDVKERDRQTVRAIPEIMANAGFEICRA